MKTTTTRSLNALLAGAMLAALMPATAAQPSDTAPCRETVVAEAREQLTRRLDAPAASARERVWRDAQRRFAATVQRDAALRSEQIADTVAARARARAVDGMLQLAAVPGNTMRSGDDRAIARSAGAQARPLLQEEPAGSTETSIAIAHSFPPQRCR